MVVQAVKAGSWRRERRRLAGRGVVAAVLEVVRGMRRAARERAQLLRMTDRELQDIGLSRIDALQAAERPLWWWR